MLFKFWLISLPPLQKVLLVLAGSIIAAGKDVGASAINTCNGSTIEDQHLQVYKMLV